MKKYKFARLYYDFIPNEFVFSCTDLKLVDEIISELQKMFPQAKLKTGKNWLTLKKFNDDKGSEAKWWLITSLCEKGWEPFSTEMNGREIYFRFEYVE